MHRVIVSSVKGSVCCGIRNDCYEIII